MSAVLRSRSAAARLALALACLAPACAIADPGAEPAPRDGSPAATETRETASARGAPSVPLRADTLAAWRQHVLPRPDELAWAELPWLPSFHEGVAAAGARGAPLLLWVMNGHPLGCT